MPAGISSIEVKRENCEVIDKMVKDMEAELADLNDKFEEVRRRSPKRASDGMPLGKEASELWARVGQLNQQLGLFRGRKPAMPEGAKRWRAARKEVLQSRGVFNEVFYGDLVTDNGGPEVSSNFSVDEAVLKNDPFWGLSGGA